MKTQKCCAHCPGKLVPPGSNNSHECCQPRYVSGNLRRSSLNKHIPDCPRKRDIKESPAEPLPENRLSCYDHFATAKKLHAENLMHQPLPDKVADCVFKNIKPEEICNESSEKCSKQEVEGHSMKLNKRYGPVLGCKAPKTKIDLAICWETPINPVYEPPRPTHIDGTEGGLAPAIFTLVQHNSTPRASVRSETAGNGNDSLSHRNQKCKSQEDLHRSRNEDEKKDKKNVKSCCDYLCNKLNGVDISSKNQDQEQLRRSFRKCVACETRNTREDPRLIRSAVGLALGTEKTVNDQQRDGSKSAVPRPKTPFARRSFRIDTLTPPFSIINGCRDIDFPEHWRLMSVYQQSYRNPYRRRI